MASPSTIPRVIEVVDYDPGWVRRFEQLRADDALREEYGAVKKRVGATARDIYEYGTHKVEGSCSACSQRVRRSSV